MDMIPIQYFLRVNNVGDKFSPEIVRLLSAKEPVWTSNSRQPHLLGIGSILSVANEHSFVWGTGIMHPKLGVGNPLPARVLALRGKLSYKELSRALASPLADVPLGDPGFLADVPLQTQSVDKSIELALIAHYVDQKNPYVQRLSRLSGVKLLDVHQEPETFIRDLAQCRYAISSSLHGLVFAEAFGIPNAWVEFSDQVAGEGFKFHDWFSLARKPQKAPIFIDRDWSLLELQRLCQPHEMDIDRDALSNALTGRIAEIELKSTRADHLYSFRECRTKPVPIFIISFNRGDHLVKSIESYRRLRTEVDIVVHDNGSTDPHTLATLDHLASAGVKVFRSSKISTADELENINSTIDAYFSDWAEPTRYVVTDCDVSLSEAASDILVVFNALLDNFRHAACVGPMLKIHDIPSSYVLRNHALNRHIDQFWHREPLWFSHNGAKIAYQHAMIDTTFALYRAGERFRRLQHGIRVYYPYEAGHLDWYDTGCQGETYRITSSPAISHWNSQELIESMKNEPLRFSQYVRVVKSENGELMARNEQL
ncbi:polysaccharide pyruvyl transferase family protein [Mesorhizobium sp.]|uniref:polysaccharide pyruvyl transferase family protein n=1 Tax=Mesorhizobium sp. TaxID=1871066 RepID=UPI0025BE76B4|nr:polysaccharide pyruvyl transferase family protein [Mesorhizobium sp.]